MEYEHGKKRKSRNRPYLHIQLLSVRSLILCISFFVFIMFLSSDSIRTFPVRTESLRPVLRVPALSVLSIDSIQHSFHGRFPALRVEDRVQFPDHLLLILSTKIGKSEKLDCVYYREINKDSTEFRGKYEILIKPAISADDYDAYRSIVRCPNAPLYYSAAAELQRHGGGVGKQRDSTHNPTVHNWERVVYEAVLDGDTAVIFVKGLNLRPHKESNPSNYRCQFGVGRLGKDKRFSFVTEAVAAAQEVVRCILPWSIRRNLNKAQGIRVTIVHTVANGRALADGHWLALSHQRRVLEGASNRLRRIEGRQIRQVPLPTLARIYGSKPHEKKTVNGDKYDLCVCTMLWNQASFLREWIMYHSWLGVERWFIYDNNSDDGIQDVIEELELQNYNVSRHTWPWIKTQEAGFSHCALRAKDECRWVGFFDVDEFFYLPARHKQGLPGENSLKSLVSNFTSWRTIGEIRTDCHSYGPSGLTSPPPQGVTVGYTCRLKSPERHKSIVRPDLLTSSLLNEVHHFQLKGGFGFLNLPESTAIVNHYKYQAWDTFKAKFYRRVATYVVDWRENQNKGSRDRAPGLGTEAIEPPNWRRRFCEVWDTGLKDLVLANFADHVTGYLPWQRNYLQ